LAATCPRGEAPLPPAYLRLLAYRPVRLETPVEFDTVGWVSRALSV